MPINRYQLSLKALNFIKANERGIKNKLALALKCSGGSINKYVRKNHDDLTKYAAMEVIRNDTRMTDAEILEIIPEE